MNLDKNLNFIAKLESAILIRDCENVNQSHLILQKMLNAIILNYGFGWKFLKTKVNTMSSFNSSTEYVVLVLNINQDIGFFSKFAKICTLFDFKEIQSFSKGTLKLLSLDSNYNLNSMVKLVTPKEYFLISNNFDSYKDLSRLSKMAVRFMCKDFVPHLF